MAAPTVFISYSHDSEAHRRRVLELADRLRRDGVDARLDRYELAPRQGWPHWMQEQIEQAGHVLMVCTETYHQRLMKREAPGMGLGGVWEGHLITTLFYKAGASSAKFIPLLFDAADAAYVPLAFQGLLHHDLSDAAGYAALLAHLRSEASAAQGPGASPDSLPPRAPQWQDRPTCPMYGVPGSPQLFLGRDRDLADFKRVLGVLPTESAPPDPVRTACLHGLPGVGKTTFVSALPYDADIQATYPDGILWLSLGQVPPRELQVSVLATLSDWGQRWDGDPGRASQTLGHALAHWRERLRRRRVLLFIDDVWEGNFGHYVAGIVGDGSTCVFTCRTPATASVVELLPERRRQLHELDATGALELLRRLAPHVVAGHPEECRAMLAELGHLPLAIVVAGRLLGSERGRAIGAAELLDDIRHGGALLPADAPPNVVPLFAETRPSVANLIGRSVQVLDAADQARFAQLGVFAPKPASIDLEMMAAVWQLEPAASRAAAALLVDQGLLQLTQDGRYWMHALLARLAERMLDAL